MTQTRWRLAGWLGLAVLLALMVAATGSAEHDGEPATPGAFNPNAQGLSSHVVPGQGGPHTLILVDPGLKRVAAYHVDAATGQVTLKSVREVGPDLQMTEFNSGGPTPDDIRRALQSR